MFKKQRIEVLKVRNEVREREESKSSSFGYGGHASESVTTKKLNVTIVLAVKNGELITREFNGKWDLEDVKKWEDL